VQGCKKMAGTTEGDTFCYWQHRADWFSKNTSSGTSLLRAGDRCIKTSTAEEEHLSQACWQQSTI
jgi:hypothetical protein